MSKVSVIIPVLNEAQYLRRLLTYLQELDDENHLEIIVVDGNSADESKEIAESVGVQVIASTLRCRAHQMNLGARIAQADILYFVHADVMPPRDFIVRIEDAFDEGVEFAFFRQKFDKTTLMFTINAFFTRFKKMWCRGGDQTIMVSKELFNKLNGFDEKFVIMEEYDFMRRAQELVPYHILNGETIVSSRKYNTNSWLRVMYANFRAMRSFKKGESTQKIRDDYKKRLNPY